MITKTCDRCKKEVPHSVPVRDSGDNFIDLCDDCAGEYNMLWRASMEAHDKVMDNFLRGK